MNGVPQPKFNSSTTAGYINIFNNYYKKPPLKTAGVTTKNRALRLFHLNSV
jgi:hypothetical protein